MTDPHHLKITGPEDILGFIPHSLGYWPENSLVAMTLQGKRLGATLRVDLPGPGGATAGAADGARRKEEGPSARGRASAVRKPRPGSGQDDTLAGYARSVVSYLQADDAANGTLLAIFTAAGPTGAGSGDTAWRGLLKELELALEAAGMPVRDAWIVGAEFWCSAHCSDPECCAPPGRPVEEIRNSRMNAEMVFRGSSVGAAPGAADTVPLPRPPDPAVRAAEFGWTAQFSARRRDRAQFAQVLDVWTSVIQAAAGQPPDLPPELSGYLRASLCIPSWRDAVIVMAAAGRAAAERGAEDFGMFDPDSDAGNGARPGARTATKRLAAPAIPDPPVPVPPVPAPAFPNPAAPEAPAHTAAPVSAPDPPGTTPGEGAGTVPGYGEVLLGLAPSVPDWEMMGALECVLRGLGNPDGGEATAAAVTVRGWIEWCRGRGSYADALYRQVLQGRPGYRLAELLAELGRRGTLCGWAARREAAWQKFAPDAA
ncbi:DUF4192 family protein [Arthrobacter sp. PM3]|uniref:DUF4192 family protein n=1 Tax=Arthrobacter sp. PM3 TaxID=2017685 RepID=UPI000E103F1B|nr:DUF4192 family protein [Arthrobacter sp. PM3]AXJ10784.1 hypothetical protein CFN17_15055 [Arthrobacter sp. PM3]